MKKQGPQSYSHKELESASNHEILEDTTELQKGVQCS